MIERILTCMWSYQFGSHLVDWLGLAAIVAWLAACIAYEWRSNGHHVE